MKEYFNDILDKDETIINVFKPNKLKLYLSVFLSYLFASLMIFLPILFGVFFGEDEAGNAISPQGKLTALIILAICAIAFLLLTWLLVAIYYKNVHFAYSNKRIIIRKGIFGIDFKSLDMSMIGAVNIYVSLLDKILRKNTGTITFGSTASPMINAGGGTGSLYRFANITKHYETYKEVKNVIDEFKASKSK